MSASVADIKAAAAYRKSPAGVAQAQREAQATIDAIVELPAHLLSRAERLGAALNEEYFDPTVRPRSLSNYQQPGSRLAAFWRYVEMCARHASLSEQANGDDTLFVAQGGSRFEAWACDLSSRSPHWDLVMTLQMPNAYPTREELRASYEGGGFVIKKLPGLSLLAVQEVAQ